MSETLENLGHHASIPVAAHSGNVDPPFAAQIDAHPSLPVPFLPRLPHRLIENQLGWGGRSLFISVTELAENGALHYSHRHEDYYAEAAREIEALNPAGG